MKKAIIFLLLSAKLFGCHHKPRDDSVIVARIQDSYTEEDYRRTLHSMSGGSPFRSDVNQNVKAGITGGVTLEQVRQGRFVQAFCVCGAGCYARLPVLLPANTPKPPSDRRGNVYVELDYDTKTWSRQTRTWAQHLAGFRRYIDDPWGDGVKYCEPSRPSIWLE